MCLAGRTTSSAPCATRRLSLSLLSLVSAWGRINRVLYTDMDGVLYGVANIVSVVLLRRDVFGVALAWYICLWYNIVSTFPLIGRVLFLVAIVFTVFVKGGTSCDSSYFAITALVSLTVDWRTPLNLPKWISLSERSR